RSLAAFAGSAPFTPEPRKRMVESMFDPTTTPELREAITAMMLAAPEATVVGAGRAMFDPVLQEQANATIAVPALSVFAGGPGFGKSDATREVLPDWTSETYDANGHFLMMEDPARFNAALRAFLEQRARF